VNANELIDKVSNQTAKRVVTELERHRLVKARQLDSFKKTEKILYEYPDLKQNGVVPELCSLVEKALKRVESDPYYDLIELKYFKHWTHECIAEYFNVDVSVISKRRTKLIDAMRPIIFAQDFIRELYGM
jgi:hypothetical protein